MKRRTEESVDPLDLLLDTVCNLFAVIIFIAVFAAILVEPIREPSTSGTPGPTITKETDQPHVVAFDVMDPELAEADIVIEDLKAELARRQESLETLERLHDRLKDSSDNVTKIRESLDADTALLEDRIKHTETTLQVPMRTPRQDTQREAIPVSMYLWRDRVHLVHDFRGWAAEKEPRDCWMKYMGESKLDSAFVRRGGSWIREQPDGSFRFHIVLRPDGGLVATDPSQLASNRRWVRSVSSLIPGKHIVYLSVRQDSFAAFAVVRSELARLGIGYDVFIEPGDDGVFDTTWITGLPTTQ